MARSIILSVLLVVVTVFTAGIFHKEGRVQAEAGTQASCQRFEQTGHTLCERFLQYWQQHGGLAQQGYPISEPFSETSNTDGKIYTVQYFERAVFEMHPENRSPNDVLLSLLGGFRYKEKYPNGAAKQVPNTLPGSQLFPQTGKLLGGAFLSYWQSHGGLAQQGYPISDEFLETSATDGKVYKVQYFERSVFEAHPEKQAPYDVLLSLLGTFRLQAKYGDGSSLPSAPPFVSGGLGLTRAEWESMHGSGVVTQEPVDGILYEGGAYSVFYTKAGSDWLVGAIRMSFNQKVSVVEARARGKTLLPADAQPVMLNQPDSKYGVPSLGYDTYFSQWLTTVFPPGTQSAVGEGGLGAQYGIWLGARPGTFTLNYGMDIYGDPNKVDGVWIYAGFDSTVVTP